MSTKSKQPQQVQPSSTVFLHGFSGDGEGLRAFADAYVGKGSHCINLPGFGGLDAPDEGSDDIRRYCKAVWRQVRRVVPEGPVRLVGHSHGAMIGYTLAVEHSDEVSSLELFCPVVRPRFMPRMAIRSLYLLRRTGMPLPFLIKFLAHPILVSMVTRYSFQSDWTAEVKHQIIRMRKREAQYYSPVMFDLMEQTLRFAKDMAETVCAVPLRVFYVTDENVASDDDHQWYVDHAASPASQAMTGGHLCVVAHPNEVAKRCRGNV